VVRGWSRKCGPRVRAACLFILILFQVIGDLLRDHSMSGGVKARWIVFLIVLPPLAVLAYLIARGSGVQQRVPRRTRRLVPAWRRSLLFQLEVWIVGYVP
jgi:hypothetical protein